MFIKSLNTQFNISRKCIYIHWFSTLSTNNIRTPYCSRWIKRIDRIKGFKKPYKSYSYLDSIPELQIYTEEDLNYLSISPIKPIWNTRRCGVLAYKIGCMSLWDDWGVRHAVTVCHVDRCVVLEKRTIEKHGYEALQLGLGYKNINRQTKPNIGRFIKLGTGSKNHIAEFKCSSDCLLPEGHYFSVRHFTPGQWVFVSGWSKAKGFKGAMRRWSFGGQNQSHGTECKAHSAPGSISQGKSVHIVWRNTKMGGHVGPEPRVTNCRVFRIEAHRNLIFLKGAVPGEIGSVVKIRDSLGISSRKNRGLHIHYPTFLPIPNHPYPVTLQEPVKERDPFLFTEEAMNDYNSKALYKGVGANVARKVKQQFRLDNDSQVRSLRKALKKFKRSEERRVIRARLNTLESQHKANSENTEHNRKSKNPGINPFLTITQVKRGVKGKNKVGPKPIRLGLSLDLASDVYGGAALMKDFDPHHRKISTLNFIGSYLHTSVLPSLGLPEICLVGRSNVGKSSFINSLMSYVKTKSRKCDMAFVSKTPGYTKSINIFEAVDHRARGVLSLVDLPGYGYTKVKNKETRKTMQSILKAYLKRRLELKLVLFLVDGSTEPQKDDYEVLQYFRENDFPHIFILTKMDKVTVPRTPGQILSFRQYFELTSPLPILFSKFGGGDLGCVWKAILDACTDSFDVSKLNLTDKFECSEPDFSTFVGAQANVSLKDIKKMIYKNFDVLPESVKSLDMDSMSRDELLNVLKIAADRSFELQKKPLDLVQLKHNLTRR